MVPSELKEIEEIARRAGRILTDRYRAVSAERKRDQSFVTDADRESEALIREALTARFPEDRVVGEEGGASGPCNAARVWHVDPLDGTTNYVQRIPLWCVAIGLCEQGEARLGVIYHPLLDEMYAGLVDVGAWRNGERLQLRPLEGPFVRNDPVVLPSLRSAQRLDFRASVRERMLGSAQYHFAMVACGAARAGIWTDCFSWDLMAGVALCRAAGGVVTTTAGELPDLRELSDGRLQPWPLCATDPGTHRRLLAVFEAGWGRRR